MGPEPARRSKENLGISVPIGSSLILAAFPFMDPDPDSPLIDPLLRKNAAWLTTPLPGLGQGVEAVIGSKGTPSPILIKWTDDGVKFFHYPPNGLRMDPIRVNEHHEARFRNIPDGAAAKLMYYSYPDKGFVEYYAVLQIPGPPGSHTINSFEPYFNPVKLMSGNKNRGIGSLATKLMAVRITDKTELPFGRHIPQYKR